MTKEKANRNEVVGMFLTYCRKTLVNARTDVLRERKRRRNREVLFCDLRRSELESLADWQDVPERETVFDAAGKPIGVTDKDLADALEKLCPEEQAIILLSYFAGGRKAHAEFARRAVLVRRALEAVDAPHHGLLPPCDGEVLDEPCVPAVCVTSCNRNQFVARFCRDGLRDPLGACLQFLVLDSVGLRHELFRRVAYEVVDVVHGVYCSLQKGLV